MIPPTTTTSRIITAFALGFAVLLVALPARAAITVVDYYRMGEGEGSLGAASSFQDSVGGKNLTNTSAFRSSVVSTEATNFVGSSRSMWNFNTTHANASLLSTAVNNFGLELWVRPGAVTGNRCIAYNGSVGTNGWGLYMVGNTYQGRFGSTFVGSGAAAVDTWTHLALVRNNGTATLYVNGVASGTSATAPTTPTGIFAVASAPPNMTNDYIGVNGYIDEVRFFTFTSGQFTPNDLLWFTPDITVQQPVGNSLADNDTVDFGSVSVGSNKSLTFTITNESKVSLSGILVTIGGADAGRFTITASPPSTAAVGASTTFTVRFTPTNGFPKTATLHIASNDPNESPFDLMLTGTSPSRAAISVEEPVGTPLVSGTVVGWGADSPPSGLTNIQAIAAGGYHTLALKSDGTVAAWGDNVVNQINVPAEATNVQAIAGGFRYSMAMRSNGTLAFWGETKYGEANPPVGLTNVTAIAAGEKHVVALKSDGTLSFWGDNTYKQLIFSGGTNIQAIATGYRHSLALKTNGTVVAWGDNSSGQTNVPAGLSNVVAVAGGAYCSAALKSNGTVVVWGDNSYGEQNIPAGLTNVTAIAAGYGHIVALKSDSTVVSWGYYYDGQIDVPAGLAGVKAVTAGLDRSAALVDHYLPFGNQLLGTSSAAKTFTIKNTGLDTMTLTNVTVTGGNASDFALNTTGMITSIPPSGQTTFTVIFTPGAAGSRFAKLRILNSTTNQSSFDIALSGIGTVPEIAVSQPAGTDVPDGGSRDFGSVTVGFITDMVFVITNAGTADLTGLDITVNGTNASLFTIITNPVAPVLPNGSTTFAVRFTPTNGGLYTAVLHIASNDSNENPFDITLTGTGVFRPEISVFDGDSTNAANERAENAGLVTFPTTAIGNSAAQTFTIKNIGNTNLTNIGLGKNGDNVADFAVSGLGATNLPPGASTTFTVTFAPTAVGVRSAVVAIANNDEDENPFRINLSGTANSANANLSALVIDRSRLVPGFSAAITNYTVSVRPYLSNLIVTPTLADGTASLQIRVNGGSYAALESGLPSGSLALNLATNMVEVRVTAPDTTTTKTYTIAVIHEPFGAGDVDPTFNPDVNSDVHTTALQPDGKIVIGGEFGQVGGVTRWYIARLNGDGTLDTGFNPDASDYVRCLAVQPDGKILVAGDFRNIGGANRTNIARLNPNGTADASFNPNPDNTIHGLTLLSNGQILVAGTFKKIGGIARTNLARLNADGSGDTNFVPNINNEVYNTAIQPDGKIIVAGYFNTVDAVPHSHIARLNTNGSVDASFNVSADNDIYTIALQPDGKILLTGDFNLVNGETHHNAARLNANGTVDSSFAPDLNTATVYTMVSQADGKILVGGYIDHVNGAVRNYIARLEADGSLDAAFDPDAGYAVHSIMIQPDGKILMGGSFTNVGGVTRHYIARLENDIANQTVAAPSLNRVEWLRGGASPEALRVTFEVSTNGGTNYSVLGNGTRINGGWELTALNLPTNGLLRAHAFTGSGEYNGSSSILETVIALNGAVSVPPINPQSLITLGNGAFRFSFANSNNSTFNVIASTDLGLPLTNWTVLGTASNIGGGISQFTESVATNSPRRFYRLRLP